MIICIGGQILNLMLKIPYLGYWVARFVVSTGIKPQSCKVKMVAYIC